MPQLLYIINTGFGVQSLMVYMRVSNVLVYEIGNMVCMRVNNVLVYEIRNTGYMPLWDARVLGTKKDLVL